jgi:ribosomal protein S13
MKKFILLIGLLCACSSSNQQVKVSSTPNKVAETRDGRPRNDTKKPQVVPEKVELDDPLTQVQTLCLTEGPTSYAALKLAIKKHAPTSCQDEETLHYLYNNASGVGERDARRVVAANEIQCFSEVNELPQEGVQALESVAKKIIAMAELKSLSKTVKANSCLTEQVQLNAIKGGFACGFLLSLASDETMKTALEVYTETAKEVYDIPENDKEKSAEVLMQGGMCYKMVLDGIRRHMGLDGDVEEEETPKSNSKIINM